MMKVKVTVFIPILVSALIVCYLSNILWSAHSNVPLDELLITNPSFPQYWNTGEVPVEGVLWLQTEEFYNSAMDLPTSLIAGRSWSSNSGLVIFETILLYDNPIESSWNFWIYRPEKAYSSKWPNFRHNCDQCYPKSWSYHSFADQDHIVCGLGSPTSCQVYYYWARYGQYIVSIELFAPNQGANEDIFETIVSQMDKWISFQLKD